MILATDRDGFGGPRNPDYIKFLCTYAGFNYGLHFHLKLLTTIESVRMQDHRILMKTNH